MDVGNLSRLARNYGVQIDDEAALTVVPVVSVVCTFLTIDTSRSSHEGAVSV
jgi:hypothetical protein